MTLDKRQLSLAALLMACLALYFWTQSRYPALDQKAQMGQRASISAIAFDTVVKVDVAQPYTERVWRSSLNWGYTNWKGMTFGLLFAAAFITFLRLLPPTSPSRFRALNALKGMFIGIPLGVCANCSTPIAYGMVRAGTRVETALATLFSSPTLNIYVLTTTFSLLPFHMAMLKVAGVLVVVLVVVPFLVQRFVSDSAVSPKALNDIQAIGAAPAPAIGDVACELPARNWFEAISRVVKAFLVNLWFIVKTTLPLMLLAGVLGAIVIEAIPANALADIKTSVLSMLAVSLVATFLPVPMMFDVVTTMILMASGLSEGLSMALLFALGIFSIYPAMVIARRISVALSLGLYLAIAVLATTTGLIANYLDEKTVSTATAHVTQQLDSHQKIDTGKGISDERLNAMVAELCRELPDATWQANCEQRALTDIRAGNFAVTLPDVQDTSACELMSGPEAKQACHAKIGHDYAVSTGDVANCRVIPLPELSASCNETIMVNRVKTQYALENAETSVAQQTPTVSPAAAAPAIPLGNTATTIWTPVVLTDKSSGEPLMIEHSGFQKSVLHVADAKTTFTKMTAEAMGIKMPFDFRLSDFYEPFKYGRGIASGDVDNNGFADLVFATSKGPLVFINQGNGHFAEQPLALMSATPLNTFVVSFVDINNDGWQDLFFTTYGGTNYWVENRQGVWATDSLHAIANPNTSLTMAVAFADINQNGTLDALMGNWTAGAENQFATQHSRNVWWVNNGNGFVAYDDDAVNGETLSVLLSDFNHNGRVDLVVGNDGDAPDLYYVDKTEGGFDRITPQQGVVPNTSLTTMSVDTADFNNDLRLDIFTTDMSFGPGEAPSYCELIDTPDGTRQCNDLLKGWQALKELKPQWCEQAGSASLSKESLSEQSTSAEAASAAQRKACVAAFATAIARNTRNPQLCDRISSEFADIQVLCRRMAESLPQAPLSLAEHIPQQHNNKLLLADGNGKFQEVAKAMQVDKSFWSWNSKAADLDNDGWQDILVANGFGFGEQQNEIHSNVFFHNEQGRVFSRATDAAGLKELLNTPAYTYVDLDNDGDLDIVATAIMASPRIYINQTANQGISFALRDEKGNRFCIGCKVMVYYGDKQQQMRELKLSGGYLSFDDPQATFGLAQVKQVDRVVIQWSDGQTSEIRQPLAAGQRYKITRTAMTAE